jgi:Homeobox KN domain
MEYFDFEDASRAHLNGHRDPETDAFAHTLPELQAAEAQFEPCLEDSLFEDIPKIPETPILPPQLDQTKRLRVNNTYVEVERHPFDFDGAYPMFRAKTPCDLCRRMGLDCFIAQKGALINGCTCCISLYRECSFTFTQRQVQGNYLDILGKVTEDVQECEGAVVTKRALKSLPGTGGFDESRPRKSGSRLSREAVRVLKNWLAEHAEHPYPTDVEKDRLKEMTSLKRSQISNWLANARRRGKTRSASFAASPIIGAIDIQQPPHAGLDLETMTPMERWKHSPPEHEPASTTAIMRAVADAPFSTVRNSSQTSLHGSRQGSRRTSSNDDSSYSMFQAPSLSSMETSRSSASGMSLTSALSHRSRGSFGSIDQKERRRRRRAPIIQRRASQRPRGARIFQCTFCADTFPSKYDWQRHEKSLHLALERWVCSPEGGIANLGGQVVCVFCRTPNPTTEHLETHNFMACQEKTLAERTFYRKDHVRQHLKLFHSAKFDPLMEAWKTMMSEIKSSCGFCPSVFSTWEQRADHLAAHFKNGADMCDWAAGWGFEPDIARLVENSVPPYMNANERASMDPYVAKATTPSSADDTNLTFGTSAASTLADSNCWRRLEQVLSGYIAQQKVMGHTPTDKQLQDQARLIVFENDDPWNQTAADNERWLSTLKFQHGIAEDPDPVARRLEELPMMPPYAVKGGLKHGRGIACPSERTPGLSAPGECPAMAASAPAQFDTLLDIDFDQLNFDTLDMTMADGLGATPAMNGLSDGLNMPQCDHVSGLPHWEMNQIPDGMDDGNEALMSEHDLNQLSGYMANFQ